MVTDLMSLAETVLDLEVRLAYSDRTVATLDGLVRALFGRLEVVEKELRELRNVAAPTMGPASEPPPHY